MQERLPRRLSLLENDSTWLRLVVNSAVGPKNNLSMPSYRRMRLFRFETAGRWFRYSTLLRMETESRKASTLSRFIRWSWIGKGAWCDSRRYEYCLCRNLPVPCWTCPREVAGVVLWRSSFAAHLGWPLAMSYGKVEKLTEGASGGLNLMPRQ